MTYAQKREPFTDTEIVRLAEELEEQPEAEALKTLTELSPEVAGEVLRHMDHEISSELIAHLKRPQAVEILEEMAPDSAADLMEDLTEAERAELLHRMEPPEAAVLRELIAYPHDSAGGLMSPEVVALPRDLTVEEAIEALRKAADEAETIYYTYVVDGDRRLLGVLSMRDLIINDPRTPIEEIMHRDVVAVTEETDAEEVAHIFDRYKFLALPVVDSDGRLLGIVTVDDVIDAIREEETEDMQRLVGVAPEDRVLDPWHESLRRRLPWLSINLLTAFAAAAVVGIFQGTIAKVTALAVLMPIVAGQGGNAGSQTVTVVVRGMALGEVEPGRGYRVLLKEMLLGALNGLVIGTIVATIAYLWQGSPVLGVVVALAMLFNLVMAGVAGALIPLGLRFVGSDPALASTILLTTVTDICGFLFLLGLGTLLLP
jgi:magnesium transporter